MNVAEKASGKLLGTTEVAKELQIAISTLHRWVREGRIKPEQRLPSGYLRFNPVEVQRVKSSITVK